MKNYHFKYGEGSVDISLDEKNILGELVGKETPEIKDIKEAVYQSLSAPIGLPSLDQWIQKEKVAIIVSDMTRFWMRQDLVLPHLISFLNNKCLIPDEDIVIVIANGTHIPGDDAELKTLLTEDVFNRILVSNHDCESTDLVHVGTTTRGTIVKLDPYVASRKTICVGACIQHVMAGFGGGRKSILPGVSGLETIQQNHSHCLDPFAAKSNPLIGNSVLLKNPLHEDMCEGAEMAGELFMLNLVMNAEMKLAYLFAGHWFESWQKGCETATDIYELFIEEKADVVITSCGGFPKDMSLYQGSKTIDNVEGALKLGGTLVVMMQCRDGGGPAEYFDWLKPLMAGTLDRDLRADFTVAGYIFYLNCEQAQRYRIILLSDIDPKDVEPMGMIAVDSVEKLEKLLNLEGKSIYVIGNGSTVIPKVKE